MIRLSPLIAALGVALFSGLAHAQATPVGLWKTVDDETRKDKSLIRITETDGLLSGQLEKLLDPANRPDAACIKCTDYRKDKPLIGMTLLKGVKRSESDKDMWDGGEILDPNNGKTYKVRLTPVDGGKTMAVRGYIGTPLFGRSQTWVRVE